MKNHEVHLPQTAVVLTSYVKVLHKVLESFDTLSMMMIMIMIMMMPYDEILMMTTI